jgi:hypothetical protein
VDTGGVLPPPAANRCNSARDIPHIGRSDGATGGDGVLLGRRLPRHTRRVWRPSRRPGVPVTSKRTGGATCACVSLEVSRHARLPATRRTPPPPHILRRAPLCLWPPGHVRDVRHPGSGCALVQAAALRAVSSHSQPAGRHALRTVRSRAVPGRLGRRRDRRRERHLHRRLCTLARLAQRPRARGGAVLGCVPSAVRGKGRRPEIVRTLAVTAASRGAPIVDPALPGRAPACRDTLASPRAAGDVIAAASDG